MHKCNTVLLIVVELITACPLPQSNMKKNKKIKIKTPQRKTQCPLHIILYRVLRDGQGNHQHRAQLLNQTGLVELRNKWESKEGVKVVESRTQHNKTVMYCTRQCEVYKNKLVNSSSSNNYYTFPFPDARLKESTGKRKS